MMTGLYATSTVTDVFSLVAASEVCIVEYYDSCLTLCFNAAGLKICSMLASHISNSAILGGIDDTHIHLRKRRSRRDSPAAQPMLESQMVTSDR